MNILRTSLFLIILLSAAIVIRAQPVPQDLNDDGLVGPRDLYYLQFQYMLDEKGADLTGDGSVDPSDIHNLCSGWHQKGDIRNPYTTGRAVGIHAVVQDGSETLTSGELEIQVADCTEEFNIQPAEKMKAGNPSPLADWMASRTAALQGLEPGMNPQPITHSSFIRDLNPQPGVAALQIGTFWGWSAWIGWDAKWSETYSPEGESYAMVVYFAPEAVYIALQRSEFVYSGVDVFAGVGMFGGFAYSPDKPYFKKTTLGNSVGISLGFGTKLVPVVSSMVPTANISHGISFFRDPGDDSPMQAIQLGAGASVNFSLIPISLPASVELGRTCEDPPSPCGIYSGFWPVIIWDLESQGEGNPLEQIISGLEDAAGAPASSYAEILSQQFAQMLLPFFQHLYVPGPVNLQDGVPPDSNGAYISQFLQDPDPASTPGTSVGHLISEAGQWLQSGNTQGLAEAIQQERQHNEQLLYEYMKTLEAATKVALDLGEKNGYDLAVAEGRRDDNKIFADGVTEVPCHPGLACSIVVTATEIAELFPGSTPGDFEGAWIRFDRDSLSYLTMEGEEYDWVQISGGIASYAFYLRSNAAVMTGPFLHKDYNPVADKYVELRRRKVVPAERISLYAKNKALAGQSTEITAMTLNSNGLPESSTTTAFYDSRDHLLCAPVNSSSGEATISIQPKPSLPYIEEFKTTQVGYSEEDASLGYSLTGHGFSINANILFNGVSIHDMADWDWAVIDSHEILFLPPDESALFTGEVGVQVVNPKGIGSNMYYYFAWEEEKPANPRLLRAGCKQ